MTEVEYKGFDSVRSYAVEKAKKKGVTDPDELKAIGEQAVGNFIEKIGTDSEKRYIRLMKSHKDIKLSSNEILTTFDEALDDVYEGIDKWEHYPERMKLIDLPVQIKSSPEAAEAFREDFRYKKRDGIFLVFNCGPSTSQRDFDEQRRKEIGRVREILKHKNIIVI